MTRQKTVRHSVGTTGVGIHGGEQVSLTLHPAPTGTGIVFVRVDLGIAIPARAENAHDVAFATTLQLRGAEVRTVEHLLAALSGVGVTNVFVELDGAEVPILDGSALPFVEMLRKAGLAEQGGTLPEMVVRKAVTVGDRERSIELRPAPELTVDYRVRVDAPTVGRQRFMGPLTPQRFTTAIAPARRLGFLGETGAPKPQGLGQGKALSSLTADRRLPSEGLRFRDEFVRHKVLDLVGDLALLEYPLRAHVVVQQGGHALHVAAVHELLAHPEVWELVEPDRLAPLTVHPYIGEPETEAVLAG
jgi:UDP-3-O-[3-hydroxymyristoyl] N-acetylglucosamine deacetylase